MSTHDPTSAPPSLVALGAERFVALTTFRKSGEGVSTPVWVAPCDGALVVTTPAGSGKVKRLRNDSRVLLRPCSRFGRVDPDAVPVEASAEVLGPDREHPAETAALRGKYGLEYRVVVPLEALGRRRRGHSRERLILRLTPAPSLDRSSS